MVSASTKQFSPFRLDLVNECLWRSREHECDERISLTPKAFAVLRFLVEHAGRLVTQAELIDAAWPDVVVQPEVLKAQISNIRLVLGDDPNCPKFIQTLHRRGYEFIAPVSDVTTDERPESVRPLIVGRDATLQILHQRLRLVLNGQRQVIFITGESGIGKSSLIEHFEHEASAAVRQLRVVRGQCIEGYGGKEPFYAMLDALGQLLHGPHREDWKQMLASQAPTWLVQFPALLTRQQRESLQSEILGNTRERMLREIHAVLETMASVHPLLIVFEDLQWADEATVGLISALARRRNPAHMALASTYCPADVTLDNQPLQTLARELLVHGLSHEIALTPLTVTDVDTYVRGASRTTPADGLANLIHAHTEGNPLFMVAVLEDMTRRGLLAHEDGTWRLAVPLQEIAVEVPETLLEMLEARIDRLSTEEQRILEAASAVGTVFSADICSAVANAEPEHLERLFEALTRRQQIVRRAHGNQLPGTNGYQCYEFRHALYREVLYRRMAASQRARLERSISQWLQTRASRAPETHELGPHVGKGSNAGYANKNRTARDNGTHRGTALEVAFA